MSHHCNPPLSLQHGPFLTSPPSVCVWLTFILTWGETSSGCVCPDWLLVSVCGLHREGGGGGRVLLANLWERLWGILCQGILPIFTEWKSWIHLWWFLNLNKGIMCSFVFSLSHYSKRICRPVWWYNMCICSSTDFIMRWRWCFCKI